MNERDGQWENQGNMYCQYDLMVMIGILLIELFFISLQHIKHYYQWDCKLVILSMVLSNSDIINGTINRWYYQWYWQMVILSMGLLTGDINNGTVNWWYYQWICQLGILSSVLSTGDIIKGIVKWWYYQWDCQLVILSTGLSTRDKDLKTYLQKCLWHLYIYIYIINPFARAWCDTRSIV